MSDRESRSEFRPGRSFSLNSDQFCDEDYETVKPMNTKKHFDDDLRNIPTVRSSLQDIDGKLRVFIGKGDRVVVKIDKEMPSVEIALRNINLPPNSHSIVINSNIGAMGIALAAANRDAEIDLYDPNVRNVKIAQRNVESNYSVTQRVNVLKNPNPKEPMDFVIYDISSGYSALQTIEDNLILSKSFLKNNGSLFCVAYTRSGADRHKEMVEKIFGSNNVTVVDRGKGGFRVIEAKKVVDVGEVSASVNRDPVQFSILGKNFSLLTEPGIFSKGGLDKGTRLLLESVGEPLKNYNRLLDFGCGWGPIGIIANTINPSGKAVLVDVDMRATNLAKINVDNSGLEDRTKVIATDDVKTIGGNFDLIVSNPPFHADTGELLEMFSNIKKVMSKNGKLFMVVEKSHFGKFDRILSEVFSHHYITNQDNNYYILAV